MFAKFRNFSSLIRVLIPITFDKKVKKSESFFVTKQLQSMLEKRDDLTLFYLFELEQNVRKLFLQLS